MACREVFYRCWPPADKQVFSLGRRELRASVGFLPLSPVRVTCVWEGVRQCVAESGCLEFQDAAPAIHLDQACGKRPAIQVELTLALAKFLYCLKPQFSHL